MALTPQDRTAQAEIGALRGSKGARAQTIERAKISGIVAFLNWIKDISKNPLRLFGTALKIIFSLGALFFVIVVFAFIFTNPGTAEGQALGIGEKAFVWIQGVSPSFADSLQEAYVGYFHPEQLIAEQNTANIKKAKDKSWVGIKEIRPNREVYTGNEPVHVDADIFGKNLEKATRLNGRCELDLGGDKKSTAAADFHNNNQFFEGIKDQTAYASCAFLEGAGFSLNDVTKKINVYVSYRGWAESTWKAYYIHSSYNKDNPRDLIKDADLTSEGIMKSTPKYESAMVIGFDSGQQPYYENRVSGLTLVLEKNTGVSGKLNKVNAFYLEVPSKFNLIDDERCDFEMTGENDGVILYQVKKDVLDKKNVDCSTQQNKDLCEVRKNSLTFSCTYQLNDVSELQIVPEYSLFTAWADYDFEVSSSKTIDVVRQNPEVIV